MNYKGFKRSVVRRIKFFFKISNKSRWENENNLLTSWDERTRIIASRIPNNVRVLEFGAGRLYLKSLLNETINYTSSDIVPRETSTIVCDLNKSPYPDLDFYDYIIFSGVLEYIYNIQKLVKYLSRYCNVIIASYAVNDLNKDIKRIDHGWVNDYSTSDIKEIFKNCNFYCTEQIIWESQIIFIFSKNEKVE